jgi:pimeloyl-ACP methyl ester carboxylesterase
VKSSYIEVSEGQLHFLQAGSGVPLLLLHQTSLSSEEYSRVIPLLANDFQVLALDLPGHGKSLQPRSGYRIEDHAKSVLDFLDVLEIRKVSILGHHVGARIAAEFAAIWPERIDCLVMSGCPWYSSEELKVLPHNPVYRKIDITPDGAFVGTLWRTYCERWKAESDWEEITRLVGIHMCTMARPFDIHEAASHHDISPRLKSIASPTLLIMADGDPFFSKLDTINKLITGSRTHVIHGAGFFVALEKPKEFAEAVSDFINANLTTG